MDITSVQLILESNQIAEGHDTESLELAQALINQSVENIRKGHWGRAGEEAIRKYNSQLEQIQQILNKRHGVDGMTPLTK